MYTIITIWISAYCDGFSRRTVKLVNVKLLIFGTLLPFWLYHAVFLESIKRRINIIFCRMRDVGWRNCCRLQSGSANAY
jgi:hypothetical protein